MTKQKRSGDTGEAAVVRAFLNRGKLIHPDCKEKWENKLQFAQNPVVDGLADRGIHLVSQDFKLIVIGDDGKNGDKKDVASASIKINNKEISTYRQNNQSLYDEYLKHAKFWSELTADKKKQALTEFRDALAQTIDIDRVRFDIGIDSYDHLHFKPNLKKPYMVHTYFDSAFYPTTILEIIPKGYNHVRIVMDNGWECNYRMKNKNKEIKNNSIDGSFTIIKHPYDTTIVM